jgi:DNA (cytosine-5)-methyltransferase 1
VRPKLLDLCCCEGGASRGYDRAGFDVYGADLFQYVDKNGKRRGYTRSRYPYPSHQGDVVLLLCRLLTGEKVTFTHHEGTVEELGLEDFTVIAASPPCQFYSITKHSHSNEHPDLVGPIRWLLRQTGLPYVMENVPGAPLENPLILCGAEFNLVATDEDGRLLHLKRHRLFESNLFLYGNGGCQCTSFKRRGIGVGGAYGGGSVDRTHAKEVRRGGYTPGKAVREALLGINWMTQNGLSQSIPPAYTEHIGRQLISHIEQEAVA